MGNSLADAEDAYDMATLFCFLRSHNRPADWELPSWLGLGLGPSSQGRERLRPYQVEGVKWLIERWVDNSNAILADDTGLGMMHGCSLFSC
jgi:hypothetical protein